MLKSMTGFGRGESSGPLGKITVEMKSVNHRYMDVNIRMPRKLIAFENSVRNALKKKITRGKIDVYVSFEAIAEDSVSIQYNAHVAESYLEHLREMEALGIPQDVSVMGLARLPEVFTMNQSDEDEEGLEALLLEAVDAAVSAFVAQREQEGETLRADLLAKLEKLAVMVDRVEEKYPAVLADYRNRLTQKVTEVLADRNIDESRIAAEVVIYADKICVDEETVRLKSHIAQVKTAMDATTDVGKKLDFIIQEMNREANTLLSKSSNAELADIGIEMKTEIEKIREQVQNIE